MKPKEGSLLIRTLLGQKIALQNKILCRYGRSVMELVEESVSGEITLMDVVAEVGMHIWDILKEYQEVCDRLRGFAGSGSKEMLHCVSFAGYCKACGEDVLLKDSILGRRYVPGGEELYRSCPCCGKELEDEILCVSV